jgi:PAS domain S-box-containing protein
LIAGKKKNGEEIFIEALGGKVPYNGGEAVQIIIRNITQQKKAEEELRRLNRALTSFIRINQSLVRETDEKIFLRDVCKLLCNEGGYLMAWVGYVENDSSKIIKPVVWEGKEDGYLSNVPISFAKNEYGSGPAGIAVRTKKTAVFQNIQKDIHDIKWKKNVVKRGYASIIAIPLIHEKKVFGVLGVYSGNPGAFDAEETKLLEQLADDLEFGIISIRTIEERKKSELALRDSEQRYRSLVELSPEAIIVHDYGKILYANKAALTLTGIKNVEEAPSKNLLDYVPDKYRDVVIQRMKNAREGKSIGEPVRMEIGTPGGRIKYVESIGSTIKFDGKPAAQVFIRDVTSQRLAEEALRSTSEKLRNLATHLQKAREEERTKIAREIHDELGQYLTGLKMDMSFLHDMIEEKICGHDKELLNERVHSASMLLNTTVAAVRRISSELRPAVLDSLGLLAAIEWLAEDFRNRMNIDCESFVTVEKINLGSDEESAVFRILQESLTNVKKHSAATKVTISFTLENNNYVLEIRDNGVGISQNDFSKEQSYGLLGMKERANLFGGEVEINGIKGKGTTVTVTIPVHNNLVNYD